MRFIYSFFLLICLFLTVEARSYQSQTTFPSTLEEQALSIAQHELPHQGILTQKSDGYVYVKVSNHYIHNLFPLIKQPGFVKPSSVTRPTQVGAHISVFYKNETGRIGHISEIGKAYTFKPKAIKTVRNGNKEFIVLEVEAPQLEKLRTHYGVSPKLFNHEFHITLAERKLP